MSAEPAMLFEPAAGFDMLTTATEQTPCKPKLVEAEKEPEQMHVANDVFGYKKQVCLQSEPDNFTCPLCGGSLYFPRIYVMNIHHYNKLQPPYYPCNQFREGNGYQEK